MQPGLAGGFDAVGQQRIVGVFTIAASETAPGRRAPRIVVQPFGDAAGEGLGLGLRTRQSAIELDDAGPFVKKDLPVLDRPSVTATVPMCFPLSAGKHLGLSVPILGSVSTAGLKIWSKWQDLNLRPPRPNEVRFGTWTP